MRLSDEQIRDRARRWAEAEDSLTMLGLLPLGPYRDLLTGVVIGEADMPERYPEGVSERKLGLFAVACCRRVWPHFRDDRCRQAVELAERYLEGLATSEEMRAVCAAVRPLATSYDDDGAACAAAHLADVPWGKLGAQEVAEAAAWAPHADTTFDQEVFDRDWRAQAELLREVFGNPFREVRFDPAWRTPESVGLAEEVYRRRWFEGLPALAESLEQAGCDNAEVLRHCRRQGGHVRGCWAVDLLLGKE